MSQPLTTINSIEVSALCDNACQYCPSPLQAQHREIGLMTMDTFGKAIDWVKQFTRQNTQLEINLFGIGEPTLNPHLVEMVKYARDHCAFNQILHMNTNGNNMTLELARDLKSAGINHIDITDHDAFASAKTIRIFKAAGIEGRMSRDFVTGANNWAGQVDWFAPDYESPCPWLGRGQAMVMWNGDVTTCCIDAFGQNVFANVHKDDPANMKIEPSELCLKCHHTMSHEKRLA